MRRQRSPPAPVLEAAVGPIRKKVPQVVELLARERCEPRQRRSGVTVERRRDSPDASFSPAKLHLLARGVFVKAVGRVRDNSMYAVVFSCIQPVETIGVIQRGLSYRRRLLPTWRREKLSLGDPRVLALRAVHSAVLSGKQRGRVESKV